MTLSAISDGGRMARINLGNLELPVIAPRASLDAFSIRVSREDLVTLLFLQRSLHTQAGYAAPS